MPLLHPQWPAVIDVHLIPLGVPRKTGVLITLPRFLTPAAVWLVVISSCRLAMATTLLLLLWGRYVPSYLIDSQKRDGETGERLYVGNSVGVGNPCGCWVWEPCGCGCGLSFGYPHPHPHPCGGCSGVRWVWVWVEILDTHTHTHTHIVWVYSGVYSRNGNMK